MISLQNVSLRLEEGTEILHNIDLELKKNEHWALIGRNGSGKSKLLEVICGYQRPSSGTITRFGETLPDLRETRKRIGYVASYLKSRIADYNTVLDIVLGGHFGSIGLYDETDSQLAGHAADLLHLTGLVGFEGRRFVTLSDGEKQRVLSARAFMIKPDLVIFDEPTAGLDILSREQLLGSLGSIVTATGASLVYVTHHVEEITPLFTHCALMDRGRMIYSGILDRNVLENKIPPLFDGKVTVFYENDRWFSRVTG